MEKYNLGMRDNWKGKRSTYSNREGAVIYFVQDELFGPVKVGITCRLQHRLKDLQSTYPYKLNIVFTINNANSYMDEFFMEHFNQFNIRGEWYHQQVLMMKNEIDKVSLKYNEWLDCRHPFGSMANKYKIFMFEIEENYN